MTAKYLNISFFNITSLHYKAIVLFVCLFFSQVFIVRNSFGQSDGSCMKLIKDYTKKMNKIKHPGEKETYYFSYSQTQIADKSGPMAYNVVNVQLILSHDKMLYIADDAKLYQDNINSYTIIPSQGIIVISESTFQFEKEKLLPKALILADSIFSVSKVTSCYDEVIDNKVYVIVELTLNEHGQKKYFAKKITFNYCVGDHKIENVKTEHIDGHKLKSSSVVYKEMDLKYHKKIKKDISAYIFDNKGNLLPKYSGYKVVNNRNNE